MWNKSLAEILICENISSQNLIKCQTQKIWWQFLTIPGVFACLLSLKSICKKLKVHKLASDVLILYVSATSLYQRILFHSFSPWDSLNGPVIAVVITEMVSNVDDVTQCIPVTTPQCQWPPPPPLASVRGNSPIKVMRLITSLPGAGVSPADGMRGIQIAI